MSLKKEPIILISGATATGKTQTSLKIAEALAKKNIKAEIINGDSLLFYPELNIGTAKPTLEERKSVPHHLIDCSSLDKPLNASDYMKMALGLLDELHAKGVVPLIVGGSGFYIRALLKGMYESGETPPMIREDIEELERERGWETVRELLKEKDPLSHERIHTNDHYRTVRALEFCLTHGKPFSGVRAEKEKEGPYDFTTLQKSSWSLHHIYLELPKEQHWPIMEKRAQEMLKSGLINEVQKLLEAGHSPTLKPLQSIGYKETISYLEGKMDRKELHERIYINTRRLAKSQKTFFNKIEPKVTCHPIEQEKAIIEGVENFLSELHE